MSTRENWHSPSPRLLLLRRLEVGAVALGVAVLAVVVALVASWGAGVARRRLLLHRSSAAV